MRPLLAVAQGLDHGFHFVLLAIPGRPPQLPTLFVHIYAGHAALAACRHGKKEGGRRRGGRKGEEEGGRRKRTTERALLGGEFATSICDTIADAECGGRWSCCRAHARGYGAQTENGRRAAGRREEIIPYMNAFVRACDCAIRSAGRIDSDAGRSPFFLPIDNKEGTPRKQSCGLWPGPRVSSGLTRLLAERAPYATTLSLG